MAILLLLGTASLGAVGHVTEVEPAVSAGGDHDRAAHVDPGHAERDGSLHVDPARPYPHHHCVACWSGSKSGLAVSGASLGPSPVAGAAPWSDPPPVVESRLANAPSRAPPLA